MTPCHAPANRASDTVYRLALDHPECVRRLAVLDIVPTGEMYRRTGMRMALGAWHWFFLPQPYDLPERLLAADPEGFYFAGREHLFTPDALAEYRRCLRDPAVIHAICEDYRAGATIDYELDRADLGARRIGYPTLALWGADGPLARIDAAAIWRTWAADLHTAALPYGHHLAEEAPDATYDALHAFLAY